jgi:hypothetical protein
MEALAAGVSWPAPLVLKVRLEDRQGRDVLRPAGCALRLDDAHLGEKVSVWLERDAVRVSLDPQFRTERPQGSCETHQVVTGFQPLRAQH